MTDEKLKKYFLGEISATEAEIFEEELALDAELTMQAQMIENELVDDYLRDNLSPSERLLFEKNYLITEARRKKLKFAKYLWQVVNEQKINVVSAESKAPFWQNWNSLRWAFAGLATIFLIATAIFIWRDSADKPEIVKQVNNNQSPTPKIDNQNISQSPKTNLNPSISNSQANANLKKTSPTPEVKITPTPKPTEQSAPTLITFVLLPGTLRSEGEQFIKISPNTNKVNLRLNLPKDTNKYQTYTATIKTADGETVSTFSNLKALNLNLSANQLQNRTYIIFLEGQTAKKPAESIAEYTFKVRR